jgi:hypothetical protein
MVLPEVNITASCLIHDKISSGYMESMHTSRYCMVALAGLTSTSSAKPSFIPRRVIIVIIRFTREEAVVAVPALLLERLPWWARSSAVVLLIFYLLPRDCFLTTLQAHQRTPPLR